MTLVAAQDAGPLVAPSNLTLPDSETNPSLTLQLLGGPITNPGMLYSIVPLTVEAGKGATQRQAAAAVCIT